MAEASEGNLVLADCLLCLFTDHLLRTHNPEFAEDPNSARPQGPGAWCFL